jgi:BBSome-interacting protein 1
MSKDNTIRECLPKIGFLFEEDAPSTIICKPKLMPLKTVTLEKVIFLIFKNS